MEYIRRLCNLDIYFSLSLPTPCSPFLAFHSSSLQPFLFPIFFGLIGLFRQLGTHFRLNGGVGARALDGMHSASLQPLHLFLFIAICLFCVIFLRVLFTSDCSSVFFSLSLPSQWRLYSNLPMECIWLLCSVSFASSSSVSSVSSNRVALATD